VIFSKINTQDLFSKNHDSESPPAQLIGDVQSCIRGV